MEELLSQIPILILKIQSNNHQEQLEGVTGLLKFMDHEDAIKRINEAGCFHKLVQFLSFDDHSLKLEVLKMLTKKIVDTFELQNIVDLGE